MLDFVHLEADLGEEERLIRDTAREFVADRVKPDIGEHFENGTFPTDLIPLMGELGFYAPNLEGYGSPNVSETAYGLLMQELEAGDSGLRSMASVQGALVMYPIHAYGSEAQKEKWLPKLGEGKAVGCFGLTEPEHGSDPASMETTAAPDGDGYVLNGSKTWITNAPIADVALVWARERSSDGTDGDGGGDGSDENPVRGFLVDTDRDGVTTNKIDDKLSMRASITGEIGLNDVFVPEDAVLPDVSGMKGPLSCLTQRATASPGEPSARPETVLRLHASTHSSASSSAALSLAFSYNRRNSRRWRPKSRSRSCSPIGSPTSKNAVTCAHNTSRWQNATTSEWLASNQKSPAKCSVETALRRITRRCATWRTWRPSTRTRAPTTSTRWYSVTT